MVITGIWAVDPTDALWLGEPLDTTGISAGGTFTTRGPLIIREADLASSAAESSRHQMAWRGLPAIANLRVDGVEPLRTARTTWPVASAASFRAETSPRVTTSLPALLDDVGRSVLVSRSGVILLTIQFAVLAGYAVVLVAGMLVERRRSEIALMRSRGASAVHLIAMAVIEAAVLAIPAAALAPVLAVAVVGAARRGRPDGRSRPRRFGDDRPERDRRLGPGRPRLHRRADPADPVRLGQPGRRAGGQGRQARTTLAQRLGLDLALVAVAGVALWQLRLPALR